MLPRPSTPSTTQITSWSLRVPRDAALVMLRNNIASLIGLLLFNWFFPIYPYFKATLLPKPWLQNANTIELAVLFLMFGVNILVALVSVRYPRPPYPPLRTPSKPVSNITPVRRPIKGLGTSSTSRLSAARSFTSSGYASTPLSTPSRMRGYRVPSSAGTPLNQSGVSSFSASSSFSSSPLAAYIGRHTTQSGRPIDAKLLDSLTAEED